MASSLQVMNKRLVLLNPVSTLPFSDLVFVEIRQQIESLNRACWWAPSNSTNGKSKPNDDAKPKRRNAGPAGGGREDPYGQRGNLNVNLKLLTLFMIKTFFQLT